MTVLKKIAAFLFVAALVQGCGDEASDIKPEQDAQAGIPVPSMARSDEECHEIFLPKDAGLVNAADLKEAVLAVLEFKNLDGSPEVRLRMKKTKFVSRQQDGHTFLQQPLVKEEIVEIKPGEEAKAEPKNPFYFDEAMGNGVEGLARLIARLSEEISSSKTDFGTEIAPGMNVPAGLVMEGYRRSKEVKGVLSVAFQGAPSPLEDSFRPARALPENVIVRFEERLMRDHADGCPAMVVAIDDDAIEILSPAAPDESGAKSKGPLAAVSRAMKQAAAISRPSGDKRLSHAWLVVRMNADAPCGWLWQFMQEAVQPGIGIWKIRVLLHRI